MGRIHPVNENELTRELAECVERLWNAYAAKDEAAHSLLLAEDYRAIHADGTVHPGKPTAEEMAAEPIEDYWLREFQAWQVGGEGAITNYTAEVEVRKGLSAERHQFLVGEVWMKRGGGWKCRYYHATLLKS